MSHEPHGKCDGQAGCNTDAAPPTALTPEEQADVEQWEVIRRQDVILARACTIIRRLDARVRELTAWQAEATHTIFEAGKIAGGLAKQRDALARAADGMLAEAKSDVTGEYSSPAIRALRAALAQARGSASE